MSVATLFSLNSCQSNDTQEMSQVAKTYTAFHNAQEKTMERTMETIGKYVDINTIENNASIRSISGGEYTINDIFVALPKDLSMLKRTDKALIRSLDDNITETTDEVTLKEELEKIANDYLVEVMAMAPNPSDALTLPNVEELKGSAIGELVVDEEYVINPLTTQGAISIEILNAKARGEDIKPLFEELNRINKEENSTVVYETEDDNETLRGLRMGYTTHWPEGKVYYVFGDINVTHKEEMLEAMRDWETKASNTVEFIDLDDEPWYRGFLVNIYTEGAVKISTKTLSGAAGMTNNLGYLSGFYNLYIDTKTNGDWLGATTRHELGHVLGLMHEHQRADRDDYITMPDSYKNNDQYRKIDEFYTTVLTWYSLHWQRHRVKKWWGVYYYWAPYWKEETTTVKLGRKSHLYGEYDCDSIMHYPEHLTTKKDCGSYKAGTIVGYNLQITTSDAETIEKIY